MRITPFHLTLGHIPQGVPYSIFCELRQEFLGIDPLLNSPVFNTLSAVSQFVDIKNFLYCVKCDPAWIKSLPAFTYGQYISGRLRPNFTDKDLECISEAWKDLKSDVCTLYRAQEKEVKNKINKVFKGIYKNEYDWDDHIYRADQHPKVLIEENVSTQTVSIPIEFKSDYYQGQDILGHLASELCERYSSFQIQTVSSNFGGRIVFSPMVHFTNSSGTVWARQRNVRVGCWENIMEFFHQRNGANRFETSHRLGTTYALHVVVQRILYICGKVFEDGHLKSECIFLDEAVKNYFGTSDIAPLFIDKVFAGLYKGVQLDEVHAAAFDSEKGLHYPADNIPFCCDYDNWNLLFEGLSMKELESHNSKWIEKRKECLLDLLDDQSKALFMGLPPLVLVFDEAHYLMQEYGSPIVNCTMSAVPQYESKNSDGSVDMYRLFRGTFRYFNFYWKWMLCTTISTVAKADSFYPLDDDPSYRAHTGQKMAEPVVLYNSFDCFLDGILVESSSDNWFNFIFGRARILLVESCGRPLWGAHLTKQTRDEWKAIARLKSKYDTKQVDSDEYIEGNLALSMCQNAVFNSACPRPFTFLEPAHFLEAFKKLGDVVDLKTDRSRQTFEYREQIDDLKAYALLALACALQKIPKEADLSELVRVGPFSLVDLSIQGNSFKALASSEGVFNGCAAVLLLNHLNSVVLWLLEYIRKTDKSFVSKGEFGELIERIAILKAIRDANRSECFKVLGLKLPSDTSDTSDTSDPSDPSDPSDTSNASLPKTICDYIFEPVSLDAFLEKFVGSGAKKYQESHPGLAGSFVAMSHFVYMGRDELHDEPYDVAANALSRGAAVVPRQGSAGVDNFIPLILRSGELSFVYIQTKTGRSYRGHPDLKIIQKASPENRLTSSILDFSDPQGVKIKRPFVYIFRSYHDAPRLNVRVFPQSTAKVERNGTTHVFSYQPCLSVSGPLENLDGPYAACLKLLCSNSKDEEYLFLNRNRSLAKVWCAPSNFPHMTPEDVDLFENTDYTLSDEIITSEQMTLDIKRQLDETDLNEREPKRLRDLKYSHKD